MGISNPLIPGSMRDQREMTTDRGDLTFSQRHGYEALPQPMRLEEISDALRREIWNAVRTLLLSYRKGFSVDSYYFHANGQKFIERAFGKFQKRSEDEVSTIYGRVMNICKNVVTTHQFNLVLDFLEIMIDEQKGSREFGDRIKELFESHGAAYRLEISAFDCQFIPCASKEQGDAVQQAFETLREGGMEGATTHLRDAAGHINAGQFADSISDSIHAVESAARVLDPKASKTLTPALNSLEKAGVLKHRALKEAFAKLYGYTSDEQGIRHALLDQNAADVGLEEALFMFGACASFAAYLTEKHRQVKIVES